jgi:hypothetical protein
VADLRRFGLSTITYDGRPAVRIRYPDPTGGEASVRIRLALAGDGRFRYKSGCKPCLYGLDRLGDARRAGYVLAVEGESDCHVCWFHDVPAIGIPGANNWKEERDAPHLAGIDRIYLVIEPDRGGEAVMRWLTMSAIRDRVWLVNPAGHGDVRGLYLADRPRFRDSLQLLLDAATAYPLQQQTERAARALGDYAQARELLDDPGLLDRIDTAIRATGFAGDTGPAKLVYLTGTSRLLPRPINLILVALSAAGKNATVDAALSLIPDEELYRYSASSERALIYSPESFEHRIVVVAEADSIPENGPAASAIRSIMDDNRMVYDVVERDEATGQWVTRRIEKPGPTGLITTSTRSLGEQASTRALETTIPDDRNQTRDVMHAEALEAEGNRPEPPELAPFHALQRWLRDAGVRQVVVPFARALSRLIPADQVRMRRDFKKILAAIQAHALLYQCQRERDGHGRIVATLADYAGVRPLLAPLFDAIVADGITPAIRETVMAVPDRAEISQAELARRLGLARQTLSWRVHRCIAGGWLVNNETRPGHQAKVGRGAPLPEERHALPIVEALAECLSVSMDSGVVDTPSPHPPGDEDPVCRHCGGSSVGEMLGERWCNDCERSIGVTQEGMA